ncbi:MAG: hypothetical protein IJ576_07295 [Synergistaceae bacterium]|nr:hypothetical protein [Synergistaceae bacterium]
MAWLFWGALRVIIFGLGVLFILGALYAVGESDLQVALILFIIGAGLMYYGYYGFNSRGAPEAVKAPTAMSQQQEQPEASKAPAAISQQQKQPASPENIENQDVDIMKIIRQSK